MVEIFIYLLYNYLDNKKSRCCMNIKLSDHFTYSKILRFTLPSIAMMIFSSIYGVVDGFFVSNFVGKTQFAAVNFIMPFLMITGAFGFMFGAGGSALVSKTLGEGDSYKANRIFSLITYASIITGFVIALLGFIFIEPIASFLGATGQLLEDCVVYGRIVLIALPAFMLQMEFQSFFITAEKPQLGFTVTLASGIANMVLDWLFIAVFKLGLIGAATATGISQLIGGVVPIIYFSTRNTSLLKLTGTSFYGKALLRTCTNGFSELLSNISMSVVGIFYNAQLMKYEGENGVAAYGVLMYVSMIFMAIFIGYTIGTAPIIGFNYGSGNSSELKSIRKKSIVIIGITSVAMLILGEVLALPLSKLFAGQYPDLLSLTLRGFLIYSFSFLFSGIGIFGSGFFTALNNGLISALISFLRTSVLQTATVFTLPLIFGTDGIWLSIIVSDFIAAAVTVVFIIKMKKKYNY